jgi:hypothetical protein
MTAVKISQQYVSSFTATFRVYLFVDGRDLNRQFSSNEINMSSENNAVKMSLFLLRNRRKLNSRLHLKTSV